jgi:hypothetical protein
MKPTHLLAVILAARVLWWAIITIVNNLVSGR